MTSFNTYDLAGRITSRTDFDGRTTTYAYALAGRQITETYSDGTTRITLRHKDGKTQSITGTAQIAQYYTYGVNEDGSQWTKVCQAVSDSPVWSKTTTDLLGRIIKEERPGYAGTEITEYFYNSFGQLVKTTTTGQSDTLYVYDALGNVIRQGLDINGNGSLDLASMDRITESDTSHVQESSCWFLVTEQKVYATDNSANPTTTSITKQQLTGLPSGTRSIVFSTDVFNNTTVNTLAVDRENALVINTIDLPSSSQNQVSVTRNGLLMAQTSASGNTITYAYDALGRTTGITDPRIGASVTHYNANGRIDYTQDPAGNTTTFAYDSMGRRISATDPLANTVRSSYTDHGQLEKTWGSGAYPVHYEYDSYGRMTKMRTYRGGANWSGSEWPASPGTADITEWIYHEASGLLIAKKDAVGKSVAYTYGAGGRLATRIWSRQDGTNALATTYAYNDAGDITGIDYSDSTPDVTFTHDRLGRQLSASSSVSAHIFAYDSDTLSLVSETVINQISSITNVITRSYDNLGRASGFDLDSDYKVNYGYDTFGRMNSVSSMDQSAEYSYLPGSDLISGYTMGDISVTRSFEPNRNLITEIENKFDANILHSLQAERSSSLSR